MVAPGGDEAMRKAAHLPQPFRIRHWGRGASFRCFGVDSPGGMTCEQKSCGRAQSEEFWARPPRSKRSASIPPNNRMMAV